MSPNLRYIEAVFVQMVAEKRLRQRKKYKRLGKHWRDWLAY